MVLNAGSSSVAGIALGIVFSLFCVVVAIIVIALVTILYKRKRE